jgi:dimethylargininase
VFKVGSQIYVGISGTTTSAAIEQLARSSAGNRWWTTRAYIPRSFRFPKNKAHVVILDDDLLLMSSAAERTAALFAERGYRLETVDISEYEKLEGCVTCLSVRVRRQVAVPRAAAD